MKQKSTLSGFALLNTMLGILLLTGIIYLIMHAMSNYHAEENSRAIGEELATVTTALLKLNLNSMAGATSYHLVYDATLCANANPLLKNIPTGFLQSLATSGFDLCTATVTIN